MSDLVKLFWDAFDGHIDAYSGMVSEESCLAHARGVVGRVIFEAGRPTPTPIADQPEGVKPKYIGTIGHVDHGKTSLTAAITRILATQPPTPASGEQMEVVAWQHKNDNTGLLFYEPHVSRRPDYQPLVTLEAAQKAIADRDAEIERLTRERDVRVDDLIDDKEVLFNDARVAEKRAETAEAQLAQCMEALKHAMALLEPFEDDGLSLGLGSEALAPIRAALQQKGGQSDAE